MEQWEWEHLDWGDAERADVAADLAYLGIRPSGAGHTIAPAVQVGDVTELAVAEVERFDDSHWGGVRRHRPAPIPQPEGYELSVACAVGDLPSVLAAVSGLPRTHAWVANVTTALSSDRAYCRQGEWTRMLTVRPGWRPMYHVTRVANRESIRRFGLDWNRMGSERGIAGSRRPEQDAVFLGEHEDISFFAGMVDGPVDVWEVDCEGLWLHSGPDGWWMVIEPIPAERLRLQP